MKTNQQNTIQLQAEKRSFVSAVMSELSERRVLRTLGAYAVAAFVVLQLLDATGNALLMPQWLQTAIASLTIIGFPVTFLLVWLFQITPDGIKLQRDGFLSRKQASGLFAFMLLVTAGVGYGLFNFYSTAFESGESTQSALLSQPAEVAIDEASIAVLPFADMSPNKDQAFIGDGIAEEVLNLLAQINGLKVAARTSSFALRDGQQDIQTIGRLLNVSKVLEGSVRREGDRIRLTAQLINVADGFHIWSKTYDKEITDLFDLQDEIAASIANELVASIDQIDKPMLRFGRTKSIDAWKAYQTGRTHWWKRGADDLLKANIYFEEAIDLDPTFAAAYAGLADSWLLLNIYGNVSLGDAMDRSFGLIETAIEYNPQSAEAFAALGLARWKLGELDAAESSLRRAVKLDGNYIPAQLWLAGLLGDQLRIRDELQVLEPALELDPLNELLMINYIGVMVQTGGFDAGISKAQNLLEAKPSSILILRTLSKMMFQYGRITEAWDYAQQALALSPEDPMVLSQAAQVSMLVGNLEESRSLVQTLKSIAPDNEEASQVVMLQMLIDEQFEELQSRLGELDPDTTKKLPIDEIGDTFWRGWMSLNLDQNREALDNFDRLSERMEDMNNDGFTAELLALRAVAEQRLGLTEEMYSSLSQARAAVRRMQVVGIQGPDIHYKLSCIEAISGNSDEAIVQFSEAVNKGFSDTVSVRFDSRLDALRGIPEFDNILQSIDQRLKEAKIEINSQALTAL